MTPRARRAGTTSIDKPVRVGISGWYGYGNLGDEAVLAGALRAIRQADDSLEVVVLSGDPRATAQEHRVRARLRPPGAGGRSLVRELRLARSLDALAVGGGGLLKDWGDRPGNLHGWVRPGVVAERLGTPSMWYAMGVDDIRFEESRARVAEAARRTSVITVRDHGSRRRLEEAGVREPVSVTADPALLLGTPVRDRSRQASGRVVVCPRHWAPHGPDVERPELQDRLHGELARALDELVEKRNVEVVFVPFSVEADDDDTLVCASVIERMRHRGRAAIHPRPASAEAGGAELAKASLVVGTRLHSLILASASGVPVFGLDYMPKVRFFLERIGEPDARADLDAAAAPGFLSERLLRAFDEREATAERLARVIPCLQALARLNGELLVAVASGRSPADLLAEVSRSDAELARIVATP